MKEEARITPCKHFFHGPCLRKWLAVKMVCPLCYSEIEEDELIRGTNVQQEFSEELNRSAEVGEQHHHVSLNFKQEKIAVRQGFLLITSFKTFN